MSEDQRSQPEKPRRATEKMRAESIVNEMAAAVRFLGGDGPALVQNNRAARLTGLPVTTIERLRWRKVGRPFADLVDCIREALIRHNEGSLARAKHELFIARQEASRLAALLSEISADFYGPEIDRLGRQDRGGGSDTDI